MLQHIMPLIPPHSIYVEPFFGGGAVFWAKEPGAVEIINDFNGMVVNFYEQLRCNFEELKRAVDATPYARQTHKRAMVIYDNPYIFKPLEKAWAFWVVTIQGFNNTIGSWRSSQKTSKEVNMTENKKGLLSKEHSERLKCVQIECKDAIELLKKFDTVDTFFYVDPPYVDADQGHYGGYMQEHFNLLLDTLADIKGKFLLSSYPNEALDRYRVKYKWHNADVVKHLTAANTVNRNKTECLTFNYSLA